MRVPLLAVALAACDDRTLEGRPVRAPLIPVEVTAEIQLESVMPSDAALRADGSVLVLDGYAGRVLALDPTSGAVSGFAEGVGRGARLAPSLDGGWWVVRPARHADPGTLLELSADGAEVGVVLPRAHDGSPIDPVDVLAREGSLIVAQRDGGLVWLGADGVATRSAAEGLEGRALRRVVDLAELPNGFGSLDSLEHRLTSWTADGQPLAAFGRFGLAAGTFARPTSAAAVGEGWWTTDATLGALQAFDAAGALIGTASIGGEPARFGHPIAVRVNPARPGVAVVLEARPARVRVIRHDPLPPAGLPALLRTPLIPADVDPAGETGEACATCHDGLVLDGREVWDGSKRHHPVGVEPGRPLPASFPLDDQGRLTCRTCHSPHSRHEPGDPRVPHAAPETSFLRLDAASDALCTACHEGEVHDAGAASGAPTGGGHPAGAALIAALKARGDEGMVGRTACLSCHAPHGAASEGLLREASDTAACVGCHPAAARPATSHPLGRVPGRDLVREARGTPVKLGSDGGVGCLTCHGLTESGPSLLRAMAGGGPVCRACHGEASDVAGGAHAGLARGGAPVCATCHDVHGGDRERLFLAIGSSDADPRACRSCHERVVPGRGHPVTGQPLDGGGRLDCLTCHDPHAADAPDARACGACHPSQESARVAGGHGTATCLDCHPAHGGPPAFAGRANPASRGCLACHDPSRAGEWATPIAVHTHPAPHFQPGGPRWDALAGLTLFGADGEPVAPTLNGDLACPSCHVVHGPDGGGASLLRGGPWREACAACHGAETPAWIDAFHDPVARRELTP